MSKKLHVVTLATKSYINLINDYFFTTLPKEVENMKLLYLNDMDDVRYSSATKFLEKRKLEMLCEEIRANLGNNIFFIDGDVVFARGATFQEEINELLEEYDLAFQFNDQWYNFGVFALSCNEGTLEYFEHMLNVEMEKAFVNDDIHDQHIMNALLGVYVEGTHDLVEKTFDNLKHTSLPIKYFANHFREHKYPIGVPEDVVFMHATNTYSMAEKLSLMLDFKFRYYDSKR